MLLDKGRGIGGRLATRWSDLAEGGRAFYDHGAQFFTVRSAPFQALINELLEAGVVREWCRGFAGAEGIPRDDGHPRYVVPGGMNTLARHLARDLDISTTTQVTRISRAAHGWLVETAAGQSFTGGALILTPPVPQSLALLDAGNTRLTVSDRTTLEAIDYDPCFALLAELDGPGRLPDPGAIQLRGEASSIIDWIADNHRKGISPDAFTVTIHASPDFTRQYWDAPHDLVAGMLLDAAVPRITATVRRWQVHRWRYSQPVNAHPEPYLRAGTDAPLLFAGDAFGHPRVEGAFLSGRAAAISILQPAA